MKMLAACLLVLFVASCATTSVDAPAAGAAPAWFLKEIATLTAGTGRWIANNARYKNDPEPFDAYGTEWKSSFGGTTMSGRLFGLRDGKEVGTFWEFRQYWHPQNGQAVLEQFGWGGTVGIGTMWREAGTTKSDQTFSKADGTASRSGHISSFPNADTYITDSFDIVGDTWTPNRNYVWRRQ